ncbi:MAG: hypothetical protein ACRBC3_10360 [Burkholderiaceae bacterium]
MTATPNGWSRALQPCKNRTPAPAEPGSWLAETRERTTLVRREASTALRPNYASVHTRSLSHVGGGNIEPNAVCVGSETTASKGLGPRQQLPGRHPAQYCGGRVIADLPGSGESQ